MTHDEIIAYFKTNKAASKALGYGKGSISSTRFRGVSREMQIRAFNVSGGALQMDAAAQQYFDFLMNKTNATNTQTDDHPHINKGDRHDCKNSSKG